MVGYYVTQNIPDFVLDPCIRARRCPVPSHDFGANEMAWGPGSALSRDFFKCEQVQLQRVDRAGPPRLAKIDESFLGVRPRLA